MPSFGITPKKISKRGIKAQKHPPKCFCGQMRVRVRVRLTNPNPNPDPNPNAYVAKNRVDSQILDNNNNSIMAKDIPISTYLPMDSDIHMLYLRMTTIVSRILVKHIPYFKDFRDDVLWHIQHCYSEEMLKKVT